MLTKFIKHVHAVYLG